MWTGRGHEGARAIDILSILSISIYLLSIYPIYIYLSIIVHLKLAEESARVRWQRHALVQERIEIVHVDLYDRMPLHHPPVYTDGI